MATKPKPKVIKPGVVLAPVKHHWSPNWSSRGGAKINLLVYHETAGHYAGDVSWLCNPKADASAHAVLREDGKELTQLVRLHDKAWHAAYYNPHSIGIEHSNVTSKGYSTEAQLQESARLFGWLCVTFDIPVRIAKPGHWVGICRHQDLGALGGGHTQCGMGDANFHRWLEMIHEQVQRGGYRNSYLIK